MGENPERKRARDRAYRQEHRAACTERVRAWRAEHPERQRESTKRWYDNNRERRLVTMRAYSKARYEARKAKGDTGG